MLEEIMKAFKEYREAIFERLQEIGQYRDEQHKKNESNIATSEDALCEISTNIDQRLADIEDALCALSDDTTEIGAAGETEVK